MTTETTEEPGIDPRPISVVDVSAEPDADLILKSLVAVANKAEDFGLSVTLHVSGLIVSGTLISYAAYWEALLSLAREGAEPASRAGVMELFEGFADLFGGTGNPEPSSDEGDHEAGDLPSYIHLRDATVFAPGVRATLPRTVWRGRLAHVSAWSLGTLRES